MSKTQRRRANRTGIKTCIECMQKREVHSVRGHEMHTAWLQARADNLPWPPVSLEHVIAPTEVPTESNPAPQEISPAPTADILGVVGAEAYRIFCTVLAPNDPVAMIQMCVNDLWCEPNPVELRKLAIHRFGCAALPAEEEI
jgi:hypothetical protein